MKKTLILIIIAFIGVVAFGQNIFKYNVTIERTTPTIFLKGSGGIIDFNSNDVRLTLSSNLLTLSGGNLSLGSNSITSGSWQGSAVTDSYISSAATWNAKQAGSTILTNLSALTNSAGYLYNNGSGTLSWGTPSGGSMTWPATAGIAVYSGSSSWGTSITDNSTNWNTAYTDRLKWDGGATGLVAATARTSLSLDNVTNESKATMFTSPTFTGTVTIPTPFTLGATSVTTTGAKLNYLTSATGTTGTNTTNIVFSTSPALTTPTVVTSIVGGATFAAFNTVTTNLSLGGAATTMTIGGTPTTAITHNYSTNATAGGTIKTVNIGTGGASGSTTNVNIGSSSGGVINLSCTQVQLTNGGNLSMSGSIATTGIRVLKGWFTNLEITNTPTVSGVPILANPMTTAGDIIYGGTSGTPTRLGLGTANYVMTAGASAPQWTATTTATTVGTNVVTLTNPSAVSWLRVNADNTITALTTDQAKVALGITSITGTEKTASYEIDYATGDAGKSFIMNIATANTFTIPLNSTDAFPVGTIIYIFTQGAGKTTITLTSGVTGISPGSKLGITIKGSAFCWKTATNTWQIGGSLE